jgi:hypothetical protein
MALRMVLGALAVATVFALAACGAGSQRASTWSAADCESQTGKVLFGAEQVVLYYSPRSYDFPPDIAYIRLRDSVSRFRVHGCDPAILGRALGQELTRAQRRVLLSHLPTPLHRYVSNALEEAGAQT